MSGQLVRSDNRGASPVIGVILMVAITVILAAVIGTFVLGSDEQIQGDTPQASFSFDYDGQTNVTITHDGGEDLDNETVEVLLDGVEAYPEPNTSATNITYTGWETPISSGDAVDVYNNSTGAVAAGGDTVRIIWVDPSGGASNTLVEDEWPN